VFNFFIERPVFSTVIALLMILVGTLAAVGLPISQYPQVVPPQVTVTTSFPGANADVIAQSVAAPIEQQVNGAQDMLYMSSKSGNDGSYSSTVTFDIGTDKNIDAVSAEPGRHRAEPASRGRHTQRHFRAQVDHRFSRSDFAHLSGAPVRRCIPEQLCTAQPV
jgi:multidrug efflux pump subunit AcrB